MFYPINKMIVEPINSENDIHFGELQYVLILPTDQIASLYRHIFNLLHSLGIEHLNRRVIIPDF